MVQNQLWKTQIFTSQENWLWFANLCLSAQADGAGWGRAVFWGPGEETATANPEHEGRVLGALTGAKGILVDFESGLGDTGQQQGHLPS